MSHSRPRHAPRASLAARAIVCLVLGASGGACRSAAVDLGAIGDAQLAARVKTALVNDADLGVRPIEVRVVRGVARLSGRVRSQDEITRAVALARSVPGVNGVENALQIGADLPLAAPAPVPAGEPPGFEAFEPQAPPGLLAIGGALGWSGPRADALRSRTTIGPLVRLGSGSGLGVAIGFDWFKADFSTSAAADSVARVHIKPVMAGLAYTFRAGRTAISPGVVGGLAFNGVGITDTGATSGPLAVEVGNSLVWRPAVSLWADAGSRWSVNVTVGYLMTGLTVTVLESGRLSRLRMRGDTLTVGGGLAYKLF